MEFKNENEPTGEVDNAAIEPGEELSPSASTSEANQTPLPKSKNKVALSVGVALIAIAGTALVLVTMGGPTKLQQAAEACSIEANIYASLDDDGKGLYLDGEGEESSGVNIYEQLCVLNALEVPDSVISRMSNTTSLMGQQEGSWDGITVLWTYHPSNGLDISLELD